MPRYHLTAVLGILRGGGIFIRVREKFYSLRKSQILTHGPITPRSFVCGRIEDDMRRQDGASPESGWAADRDTQRAAQRCVSALVQRHDGRRWVCDIGAAR